MTALITDFASLREANESSHARTDDRISGLHRSVGALEVRIGTVEDHHKSANIWLMTVAAIIVTVGVSSIGFGGYLNAQVAGILARTSNLEQEMSAAHAEQQSSNAAVRSDIATMGTTIATMSAQLGDLQRCIINKRGC